MDKEVLYTLFDMTHVRSRLLKFITDFVIVKNSLDQLGCDVAKESSAQNRYFPLKCVPKHFNWVAKSLGGRTT